ncbi:MAB_1171c family putative transporter [Streptomyces sp. TLI_146]|uniref:MAB_1171c family putative transporter n=1 Tax=Streptomyces sp. TLI_146 TaxID=1938858 RepID=UPI0027D79163|nr:MAB_1171c family putative transporter [Streptomyces sp. TLI_146]
MTAVALWRLPALRYSDPLRRTLWGCSAGFAVALWARFPPVKAALDCVAVDFSALVKYFFSMIASLALLNYAVTSYGAQSDPPRHIVICRTVAVVSRRATIIVIPTMVILFFTLVDRSHPTHDFAADHAGQWGAAVFMTLFYLYLGSAAATCAFQWGHVARRAETNSLRAGLTLGSAATWLYAAYSVVRVSFMWLAMFMHVAPPVEQVAGNAGDLLNVAAAALFATGASLPTTGVAAQRWQTWRLLYRLQPLRRDLALQFPQFSFQPLASRLREATRLAPSLDIRLDRAIQECGDAVEQLRHYATASLWPAAEEAAANHADSEAATEAYWIAAALRRAHAHQRSAIPAAPLPMKPFPDSQSEARWLVRVQDIYVGLSRGVIDEILVRAGRPHGNEQPTVTMAGSSQP